MNDFDPTTTLDPGIRDLVMMLRSAGFKTTDSGDGVSKPKHDDNLPYPHVFGVIATDQIMEAANRLWFMLAKDDRYKDWVVEVSYSPNDLSRVFCCYGPYVSVPPVLRGRC